MIKEVNYFIACSGQENEEIFDIYSYAASYLSYTEQTTTLSTDQQAAFKRGEYTDDQISYMRSKAKEAANAYEKSGYVFDPTYIQFYDLSGTALVQTTTTVSYLASREFYDSAAYLELKNNTGNGLKQEIKDCQSFLGISLPTIPGIYKYSKVDGWVSISSIPTATTTTSSTSTTVASE